MTDEEWTEHLRAFDRCREAHARTLDMFRAQVEAARRTLSRVARQLEGGGRLSARHGCTSSG